MEEKIRYHGFDSIYAGDRHIKLTTMKPGFIIRINEDNTQRYVIDDVETFKPNERLYMAIMERLPFVTPSPNEENKAELLVLVNGPKKETYRLGPARVRKYGLLRMSNHDVYHFAKQTKFYLNVIDVILPSFKTKEQMSISFEDA
jgi:hypothetical protein